MQRLDAAKKEAILNAAKQRLRKYGIQKTTMQEIAKDAGIAVGTLYLYFKNKDEILIATAENYAQIHLADAEKILSSQNPPNEKLKTYIINRFRAVKDSRISGSHAAELARTVIRLQPRLHEEQSNRVRKNVLAILQEGIQTNLFHIDDLERDIEVFLYSIGYFFPLATTEKYYEPEEEKLCMVIDWFIKQWCYK
ncbi:TetR/AcrR family transcriptional regulator [Nostocaceae cyanobacterium CENA357]|uniref:TetR/AcrR family transcriptional regulator n=1 Tax=Atlanticothrix silvestris CENA357 TaxID=1725252 RepID=A0A8J7KZC5_9CYAN|nr:TetR/AcrR family transcriptional regulator [Atlanticothrix silvestris]MBH8551799.1 TetR/AcrR family transcriptional regulator [Atlanticothrix silvestris CENA357]